MREYLLVWLIAVAVTYLAASLARRYAFRFDAVAVVRDRDVHTRPIPYFGGLAMLAGTTAAFIAAANLPWLGSFNLVRHDTWSVFWAATMIALVGAIDDMLELGALAKLSGQALAAGLVVANGVRFYWIPLPGRIISLDPVASIVMAVFVILLCVNAINLVDGLDGLAAGVVAIGASAFFVYAYLLSFEHDLVRATTASLISVVVVAVCVGFLPHNFHRARMFMGDSGSMLLGFLLATSLISLTGQIDPGALSSTGSDFLGAYLPLILPIAVMALPFLDLVMAYVRRTVAGKLWFEADKAHLHHRMMNLGHSHRNTVLLLWLWSAIVAYGMVGVGIWGQWWNYALIATAATLAGALTWVLPRVRGRRGD